VRSTNIAFGQRIGATEWDANHDVPVATQAEAKQALPTTY